MSKKVVYSISEMEKVFNKVNVSEFKLIFVLVHYLAIKDKNVFINNAETREYLASVGFKRTPVRVSTVFNIIYKELVKLHKTSKLQKITSSNMSESSSNMRQLVSNMRKS